MYPSIQGKLPNRPPMAQDTGLTLAYSAFWGHSFVTELTRISSHSEKKVHKKALDASSRVGEHLNGTNSQDKEIDDQ